MRFPPEEVEQSLAASRGGRKVRTPQGMVAANDGPETMSRGGRTASVPPGSQSTERHTLASDADPRHGSRVGQGLGSRSLAVGLFALGAPEEHALAARAEDHLGVALDLVEELGRDAHAAALADAAAHLDHRETAAAREDHLVLAPEIVVDRLRQLRARGTLALAAAVWARTASSSAATRPSPSATARVLVCRL